MYLQNLYEQIYSDQRIIGMYNSIAEKEKTFSKAYATHDLSHVNRVINNCGRIMRLLRLNNERVAEVKIAALLHDIGCVTGGKGGHAERSYKWSKNYLKNIDLTCEVRTSILTAIREHSGNGNDLCGKILAFADKIDINADRISQRGLLINGNRQYAHLKPVDFDINDSLIVKFTSNGKINIEEVNSYYFTKKVMESIQDLANYFNLPHDVFIDGIAWKI
jgi:HD superfamily phosphodiesterase